MTALLAIIAALLAVIAAFLGIGLWHLIGIHRLNRPDLPDYPISARGIRYE